jgi:hypothetical protein
MKLIISSGCDGEPFLLQRSSLLLLFLKVVIVENCGRLNPKVYITLRVRPNRPGLLTMTARERPSYVELYIIIH